MKNAYHYTMPTVLSDDDVAFNLANFLYENTGSIFGEWRGKIKVADQKKLAMRNFANRQTVYLNGEKERISATRKVCFGLDYDVTLDTSWARFEQGKIFD